MGTASAIAVAAAFNTIDPRTHPFARGINFDSSLPQPDQYEALLGRKLRPTPPRLTHRVLYIPSHNDKVTHLPLYDFTEDFNSTIQDEPIGGSKFKTRLGLMNKPIGDGRGSSVVSYLVDFEPPEARKTSVSGGSATGHNRRKSSLSELTTTATVQRRSISSGGAEVGLVIPPTAEHTGSIVPDGAVACTITPCSTTADIRLLTSFPIAPTASRFGSSRNPWFTFTVPSLLDDERTLQWQIHPVEQGMLRYTLVEIPSGIPPSSPQPPPPPAAAILSNADKCSPQDSAHKYNTPPPFSATREANEHLIRAIYHNVGLGFCFSQPYSEGALLLQDDLEPELEALIVASLLGLLWRARNENCRLSKLSQSEGASASKTQERRGSAEEGAPSSPGKKRIFGKLLGKKKSDKV